MNRFSWWWSGGKERLLERSSVYNLLQWLVGSARARRFFLESFAVLPENARVLEAGCGPGTLVPYLGGGLGSYVGFDPNPDYIARAQARFPRPRHEFFCGETPQARRQLTASGRSFDAVVAAAVLHHLDDRQVLDVLDLAAELCGPEGWFASYDNAFVPDQNPIARALIKADRGRWVRTPEAYEKLLRSRFREVVCEVRHDLFSVPYTLVFFRASRPYSGGAGGTK